MDQARSALVLQGGGALGAYELGAARALYENNHFKPDLIAGVSIGAVTAVLLARPARGLKPLEALEAFWEKVTVPGLMLSPALRRFASFFGNPNFFVPRLDYFDWYKWTYFYETVPLRDTLKQLVDLDSLPNRNATPALLVSATDLEDGQIRYFYSRDDELTLDHIVASGSLPPAFPMTLVGNKHYWDGGLFDNTPLGAVVEKLDHAKAVNRTIYVVNLFPNKAPLPRDLLQVQERMKNLHFANKTLADLETLRRLSEVAELMEAIESLPGGNPLEDDPAYEAVKKRGYIQVPRIVSVTPPEPVDEIKEFGDSDFSPDAIKMRAKQGYAQTMKALRVIADEHDGALDQMRQSRRILATRGVKR
jgi:predicted acylesterase/phospholipase RssA